MSAVSSSMRSIITGCMPTWPRSLVEQSPCGGIRARYARRFQAKGGFVIQLTRFTSSEVEALGRDRNFLRDQSEWFCPSCGEVSVRTYLRNTKHANRPAVISYTWCAACRKVSGSTGPLPPGLTISDPWRELDPAAWEEFDISLLRLFARFDRLWEDGVLPQSVVRARRPVVHHRGAQLS